MDYARSNWFYRPKGGRRGKFGNVEAKAYELFTSVLIMLRQKFERGTFGYLRWTKTFGFVMTAAGTLDIENVKNYETLNKSMIRTRHKTVEAV